MDEFSRVLLMGMVPASLVIAALAFGPFRLIGRSGLVAGERGRRIEWLVATATVPGFSLIGRIPPIGDLIVGALLLVGLGASVMTLMGYRPFRPALDVGLPQAGRP